MTRIKELEKLIERWKAKEIKAKNNGLTGAEAEAMTMQHALNLALSIFKQPSNTRMHMDKTPRCSNCDIWEPTRIGDHCPDCGRAFNQ